MICDTLFISFRFDDDEANITIVVVEGMAMVVMGPKIPQFISVAQPNRLICNGDS